MQEFVLAADNPEELESWTATLRNLYGVEAADEDQC